MSTNFYIVSALAVIVALIVVVSMRLIFNAIKNAFRRNRAEAKYAKDAHTTKRKVRDDPGRRGEFELYMTLKDLERDGFRFVFNTYLPSRDGSHYTEIDMAAVSRHGVCVIECKNYHGKVVGTEESQYWEQQFPNQTYQFFNPIKQNNGHIHALWDYCKPKVGFIPTLSLVAFADTCNIDGVQCQNEHTKVVNFSDAKDAIVDGMMHSGNYLRDRDVKLIFNLLKARGHTSRSLRRKHVRYVKKQRAMGS